MNASGQVTGIAEGTATITVTTVDGGFTDQCEISVFRPVISVTGVTLTGCPSDTLVVDSIYQLGANVTPGDADDSLLSWISSDEAVALVDTNGLVTAVSVGEATISVTTNDGGFTDECHISVTSMVYAPDYNSFSRLVKVFPNPATGEVYIRFPDSGCEKKVRVYNLYGQLIGSKNTFDNSVEIDIREYQRVKMLILKTISDEVSETTKLVIDY